MDFNYARDNFFVYVYLNPFEEFDKPKKYKVGSQEFCFAYEPIYIGKGTGAGYRQHQHLAAFRQGRETNPYKKEIFESIYDDMAKAAAENDHTKPWNWKEYQDRYIIILDTFQDPKLLLKFEIDLIKNIGTLHGKKGPLANKITNAYAFDNLSQGSSLDSFLK
jgi:hypothetical protein